MNVATSTDTNLKFDFLLDLHSEPLNVHVQDLIHKIRSDKGS